MRKYYVVYLYKGNDEPLKKSINSCVFTLDDEKNINLLNNIVNELKYVIADENLIDAEEVDLCDIVILNIIGMNNG